MNSSERKYIGDLTMLALISPEMFNESAEINNIPQESGSEYEYMEAWEIMLHEAIERKDKAQIAVLRRDIQRMKTEKRMKRRLITEQKSVREIMQI